MLRYALTVLLVVLTCGPAWSQQIKDIRIATFNIQNLGQKKVSNEPIRKYLAETIRRFDLVAVQEVSDIKEKAPHALLEEINATGRTYELLLSERSGKQPDDKNSQEQYAFFYDTKRIKALDEGQLFDDSKKDLFQREPYTARFAVVGSALTFTITQVHTRPESALAEIKALISVYRDVADRYGDEGNHILLGDFNGACSYAKAEDLKKLEIRGSAFYWVVPDTADTTVSPTTDCAYDRIVLTKRLKQYFLKWGVANWFDDKAISDHWPVWMSLRTEAP